MKCSRSFLNFIIICWTCILLWNKPCTKYCIPTYCYWINNSSIRLAMHKSNIFLNNQFLIIFLQFYPASSSVPNRLQWSFRTIVFSSTPLRDRIGKFTKLNDAFVPFYFPYCHFFARSISRGFYIMMTRWTLKSFVNTKHRWRSLRLMGKKNSQEVTNTTATLKNYFHLFNHGPFCNQRNWWRSAGL